MTTGHEHKTITELRNQLNWWKNNPKARRQHPKDVVDEMVDSLEAEIAKRPRGPGRPVGYKVSDETKAKISRSRKEGKALRETLKAGAVPPERVHESIPPPPATADIDEGLRREIWERDQRRCRGCHSPSHESSFNKKRGRWKVRYRSEDGVMVTQINRDAPSGENLITLCAFCREMVAQGGLSMIGLRGTYFSASDIVNEPQSGDLLEGVDPMSLVGGTGKEYNAG